MLFFLDIPQSVKDLHKDYQQDFMERNQKFSTNVEILESIAFKLNKDAKDLEIQLKTLQDEKNSIFIKLINI